MAKWNAIVVIMMVMIVVLTIDAKQDDWITCFRKCSEPCGEHDGDCFERCKIKCGGPNPPHDPPPFHSSPRY